MARVGMQPQMGEMFLARYLAHIRAGHGRGAPVRGGHRKPGVTGRGTEPGRAPQVSRRRLKDHSETAALSSCTRTDWRWGRNEQQSHEHHGEGRQDGTRTARGPWTVVCAVATVVLGPAAVTASALDQANAAPMHHAVKADQTQAYIPTDPDPAQVHDGGLNTARAA